ncbi:UNVERIFIED_CONTAM: hypothetical protein K2H54_017026 [Gekko kuhli]
MLKIWYNVLLTESIKWLPKSPKLHGSHNWSSQGSRWASLKGKESTHGCSLCKFSSTNEKWKEGRISPEQEAEELEDPEEDEPVSKFSGSLFDTHDTVRDQRNARVAFQDRQKGATKSCLQAYCKNQCPRGDCAISRDLFLPTSTTTLV